MIWINRILFLLYILLSTLAIAGKIAFGHGLGDLAYYVLLWTMTIIFTLLSTILIKRNSINGKVLTAIVFGSTLIFLLYAMTIGRGAEYSWNGNIFYGN